MEKEKFNWKRLFITLGIVLLTAAAVGGVVYWKMDSQAQEDKESYDNHLEELNQRIDDLTKDGEVTTEKEDTLKTYKAEGISFKYPSNWVVEKLVGNQSDQGYAGNVVQSNSVVVIKNPLDKYAIGINTGEMYGRGGACTKRTVIFSSSIKDGKVVLTKKSDEQAVASEVTDYCGSVGLKGFTAVVEKFDYKGKSYTIVSENTQVTDAVADEAIKKFQEIISTLTLT